VTEVYNGRGARKQIVRAGFYRYAAYWTFAGTFHFDVPAGVTVLRVTLLGAGAGGANALKAGGGGGGAFVRKVLQVMPGNPFDIVIGAGGAIGGDGADTVFGGSLLTAAGGKAGAGATGGAGGVASGGDLNFNGGAGGSVVTAASLAKAGGGSAGTPWRNGYNGGSCLDTLTYTCSAEAGGGGWGGDGATSKGSDGPFAGGGAINAAAISAPGNGAWGRQVSVVGILRFIVDPFLLGGAGAEEDAAAWFGGGGCGYAPGHGTLRYRDGAFGGGGGGLGKGGNGGGGGGGALGGPGFCMVEW
jgi:hypothetical protein